MFHKNCIRKYLGIVGIILLEILFSGLASASTEADCGGTSFENAQLISSGSISCSFSNGDRYFKFPYGNDYYVARVKHYDGSGSFELGSSYYSNNGQDRFQVNLKSDWNTQVDYDLYIYNSNKNEIGNSLKGPGEEDYVIINPCGGPSLYLPQPIPSGSCSFSKGDRYFEFSERGHIITIRVKHYDGNGYFTLSVHPASQEHEITVTLTPSKYADYDLYIYENGRFISSSEAGKGQIDQLNLYNPDFR